MSNRVTYYILGHLKLIFWFPVLEFIAVKIIIEIIIIINSLFKEGNSVTKEILISPEAL